MGIFFFMDFYHTVEQSILVNWLPIQYYYFESVCFCTYTAIIQWSFSFDTPIHYLD